MENATLLEWMASNKFSKISTISCLRKLQSEHGVSDDAEWLRVHGDHAAAKQIPTISFCEYFNQSMA